MEFDYPLNMTRKEALVRRANKLIGWLQSERFAYVDKEQSVPHLRKFIGLIIDVVNQAIQTEEEGRDFLQLFQEARKLLIVETEDEQELAYNDTILALISSLETYRGYIEDLE